MELNEMHKQAVREWAGEGLGLSEIQKRLQDEFSLKMSYMDVRFLLIDIGAELRDKEQPAPGLAGDDSVSEPPPADDPEPVDDLLGEAEGHAGGVSVTTDRVVQPGAVASGEVTFSDGRSGRWVLDQMGRLALDMGGDTSYRPPPQDLQDFQVKLQKALTPGAL